jgi:hypothetical protein
MGPFLSYGVMEPLPPSEPTPSRQRGQTAAALRGGVLRHLRAAPLRRRAPHDRFRLLAIARYSVSALALRATTGCRAARRGVVGIERASACRLVRHGRSRGSADAQRASFEPCSPGEGARRNATSSTRGDDRVRGSDGVPSGSSSRRPSRRCRVGRRRPASHARGAPWQRDLRLLPGAQSSWSAGARQDARSVAIAGAFGRSFCCFSTRASSTSSPTAAGRTSSCARRARTRCGVSRRRTPCPKRPAARGR